MYDPTILYTSKEHSSSSYEIIGPFYYLQKGSTLSQKTNFGLFQTERVCRRQFQIYQNGRKFFRPAENTVRKGEIAHYEQFLLSPQCFLKDLYCRHVKTRVNNFAVYTIMVVQIRKIDGCIDCMVF